jgi:hypothetical protein
MGRRSLTADKFNKTLLSAINPEAKQTVQSKFVFTRKVLLLTFYGRR